MKPDLVITESKGEVIKAAWEAFSRNPANMARFGLQPNSNELAVFEVGWKAGFHFALVAMEDGALGQIKHPAHKGDN